MKEDLYITLIHKNLSGDILPAEKEQLQQWLDESPDHQLLADHIGQTWQLSGDFQGEIALDMDADFTQIQKRIQQPTVKKEAPAKVRDLPRRPAWWSIAAGILALLGIGFLISNYLNQEVEWQLATTLPGETKTIELSDGSSVILNQNTELRYPSAFEEDFRKVELVKGEAIFEVSKDPSKTFLVQTHSSEVSVLGTVFNVKDSPGQSHIEVLVKEGKVKLQPKGKSKFLLLEANEKGIYQKEFHKLTKKSNESMNGLAWHTRKLTYEATPLGTIVMELNLYYGAQIFVDQSNMMQCPFTGSFDHQDLDTIVEVISGVFGMQAEKIRATTFRLRGGNCE